MAFWPNSLIASSRSSLRTDCQRGGSQGNHKTTYYPHLRNWWTTKKVQIMHSTQEFGSSQKCTEELCSSICTRELSLELEYKPNGFDNKNAYIFDVFLYTLFKLFTFTGRFNLVHHHFFLQTCRLYRYNSLILILWVGGVSRSARPVKQARWWWRPRPTRVALDNLTENFSAK
jgi:hypothetical protein